jgi:hypothetical protein
MQFIATRKSSFSKDLSTLQGSGVKLVVADFSSSKHKTWNDTFWLTVCSFKVAHTSFSKTIKVKQNVIQYIL